MTYEIGRPESDRLLLGGLHHSDGHACCRMARATRRTAEVVLSLLLLLLSLPVLLVAALAIRLDTPGPVIYRQVRCGLGGRPFTLLKLRSMTVDAEASGPVWAATDDPRVTRVGAVLRRLRIDELPQLLCVLRGDMSLVGPRPERPHFVDQLARDIPDYHDRALLKPGITGWAQVRFRYGASVDDARQKLAFDLYYVRNRSLALDARILALTVGVVLRGTGAR